MRSFRIIPSHPEDRGKKCIRIATDQMKSLGISSGDVMCIVGTRSTAAVCVPLDQGILPHDPEFEFFNGNDKRLPLVRLSDIVSHNARGTELLSTVQIEKSEPIVAEKIVLAARNIFSYKKENLVIQLDGMPFTKGDLIRIANREKETKFPFVEFVVVDVYPIGDIHVITDITRIEFVSHSANIPRIIPYNLKKRIQVGRQISDKKLEITLESIEIYDECLKFFLDIGYSFDNPQEWVENRMYAVTSASDDTKTLHRCVELRAGSSQWSRGGPQHTKMSGIMTPAIHENSSRLVFEIKEITWQTRQKRDLQFLDQIKSAIREEQTVVSVWQPQKMHHMIASGPWRFDVDLE